MVGGEVPLARLRNDVVWQTRRIRLLVPTRPREPIAHELLVVRLRRRADLIGRRLPVPRAVWCQRFVDEHEVIVDEAELELRVREDQPPPPGNPACQLVPLPPPV